VNKGWVVVASVIGSSMIAIDSTAVNVALPIVQRELQATSDEMLWVVEAYVLFLAALTLPGGSLGDRFGRRRTFVTGVAIFAAASAVCAAAPNGAALIVARCVQGVGGALALPQSLALVSAAFRGAERGRAIGIWASFAAITSASGPLLGGLLAQTASWRWVFVINLPLAAAVLAIALLRIEESRDEQAPRAIDVRGAALATVGLGLLVFGLLRMQRGVDAVALGGIAAGLCGLALFVLAQSRASQPMLPPDLFRSRTFTVANVYTLLLYAALGGSMFFVPLAMIDAQQYTPAAAGAVMLPFVALRVLFSRWSGGLIARFGVRAPLMYGAALAGAGFVAFALPGLGGSYWTTYFPAVLLLGSGGVLFIAPLTTTVFDASDPRRTGIASAVNHAVARVAGLLAIAALGLVFAAVFGREFERQLDNVAVSASTRRMAVEQRPRFVAGSVPAGIPPADRAPVEAAIRTGFIGGFRVVMLLSGLLAFIAAGIAARGFRSRTALPECYRGIQIYLGR
jgi:EmrB/QacA subfamily drug resistance transporter